LSIDQRAIKKEEETQGVEKTDYEKKNESKRKKLQIDLRAKEQSNSIFAVGISFYLLWIIFIPTVVWCHIIFYLTLLFYLLLLSLCESCFNLISYSPRTLLCFWCQRLSYPPSLPFPSSPPPLCSNSPASHCDWLLSLMEDFQLLPHTCIKTHAHTFRLTLM